MPEISEGVEQGMVEEAKVVKVKEDPVFEEKLVGKGIAHALEILRSRGMLKKKA